MDNAGEKKSLARMGRKIVPAPRKNCVALNLRGIRLAWFFLNSLKKLNDEPSESRASS